jgi:hypothetical protein
MKKWAVMFALLGLSAGIAFGAYWVWQLPSRSDVMLFRVVMVGFIPIPIPIGFLTSPHFWGGLLFILSGFVAWMGVTRLRD